MHGLDFLLVLNFERLCEVRLDGKNTPCLWRLSHHTSDKLFAAAPDSERMHPEFLQLFGMAVPELLKATLLKSLMAPPAGLFPLLAFLLPHAECTLFGSRIQHTALAARGKGRMTKKFS